MPLKHLIILFFFPPFVYSQSATFYADTSRLRSFTGHNQQEFDRAMEFEWRINHRVLKFGATLTDVEINKGGTDTILFRISKDRVWDTLVTRILPNSVNRFNYNTCCHYFNAIDEDDHIIKGSVNFNLTGSDPKAKKYLGTIDDSGIFLTSQPQGLWPIFRSPMLPNNYNVAIDEIRKCKGNNFLETTILKSNSNVKVGYKYEIVKNIINFRYLPLNNIPINISYDIMSGVKVY